MAHVFISYVHENWDTVIRLRDALQAYGIEVWIDRERIMPGLLWSEAIRDGISRGAFFIACFSEEYRKKDRTYMNEEIIVAIEELRLRPFNRAWFIPVLLSPTEIPNRGIGAGETLRSLQWVDLSENWTEGIGRILHAIDPESARVQELINALSDRSPEVRVTAINDLAQVGTAGHVAIPALLKALEDEQESVRTVALGALRSLQAPFDAIVSKLVSIFDTTWDPEAELSFTSSPIHETLVGLGEGLVPAVIAEGAKPHKNLIVEDLLRSALMKIGPSTIPLLLNALDRATENEKRFILGVLINVRPEDRTQIPVGPILRLIQTDETKGFVKGQAIGMLGRLRASSVVPFLLTLLNDDISVYAEFGNPAQALAEIGDSTATPAILQALQDQSKSELHRKRCVYPLTQLAGASAVPILAGILADESNPLGLRCRIIQTFEGMWMDQPDAQQALKEAVPILTETMNSADFTLRFAAAQATWIITGRADFVVPVFEEGLMNGDYQMNAARLLAEVGPEAHSAVPRLVEVLRRASDDWVREKLSSALTAIDPALKL